MADLTKTFISALQRLEQERDVATIAALFAPEASLSNPLLRQAEQGQDGATHFWSQYCDTFEDIHSDFKAVQDSDGLSFLEWRSEGAMAGERFSYGGVSVLEHDGDKITAFRTYFDTRHLPSPHAGRANAAEGQGSATAAPENSDLDGNPPRK